MTARIVGAAALLVVAVAAVLDGVTGAWSAALGAVVVVLFFASGAAVARLSTDLAVSAPGRGLATVVAGFWLRLSCALGAFILIDQLDALDGRATGLAVLAVAAAWPVGLLVSSMREQTPAGAVPVIQVSADEEYPSARLSVAGRSFPAVLGSAGVIAVADKREGDNATPIGTFTLRRVFYRADRLDRPETELPVEALPPGAVWCDDATSADYNTLVLAPIDGSTEPLWRADELYDLFVVLGHNDAPIVPGRGSAIFLHVARPDATPTAGCIALSLADLRAVLAVVPREAELRVQPD